MSTPGQNMNRMTVSIYSFLPSACSHSRTSHSTPLLSVHFPPSIARLSFPLPLFSFSFSGCYVSRFVCRYICLLPHSFPLLCSRLLSFSDSRKRRGCVSPSARPKRPSRAPIGVNRFLIWTPKLTLAKTDCYAISLNSIHHAYCIKSSLLTNSSSLMHIPVFLTHLQLPG